MQNDDRYKGFNDGRPLPDVWPCWRCGVKTDDLRSYDGLEIPKDGSLVYSICTLCKAHGESGVPIHRKPKIITVTGGLYRDR